MDNNFKCKVPGCKQAGDNCEKCEGSRVAVESTRMQKRFCSNQEKYDSCKNKEVCVDTHICYLSMPDNSWVKTSWPKYKRSVRSFLFGDIWIGYETRIKSKHKWMFYGFLLACALTIGKCACKGPESQNDDNANSEKITMNENLDQASAQPIVLGMVIQPNKTK